MNKRILIVDTPKRNFYYEQSEFTGNKLKRISKDEAYNFLHQLRVVSLEVYKNSKGQNCTWYGYKHSEYLK